MSERETSMVEDHIRSSPEAALAYYVENVVCDANEELYRKLRQNNWGFKRLSKRIGVTRRKCKRMMKRDNHSLRELALLCYGLELEVHLVPRRHHL